MKCLWLDMAALSFSGETLAALPGLHIDNCQLLKGAF
jgi:hypothetical protein